MPDPIYIPFTKERDPRRKRVHILNTGKAQTLCGLKADLVSLAEQEDGWVEKTEFLCQSCKRSYYNNLKDDSPSISWRKKYTSLMMGI